MNAPGGRIASLDGLRGLAVMGILLMNIAGFALPDAAYYNPLATGPARTIDLATWAIEFVLVDGKMRALFSLLFGASMLIVIRRAGEAGLDAARIHLNRMAWLMLFGALHFLLLWWGDILMLYAVAGTIALLFADRSAVALLRIGIALICVQIAIDAALFAQLVLLHHAAAAPGAGDATIHAWREVADALGRPGRDALARQIALYRQGWSALVYHRASAQIGLPLQSLIYAGPETLGLMLLGMAGLKSGFLTGAWERARYRRWLTVAYAIGLPPTVALVAVDWASGFDTLTVLGAAMIGGAITRPFIATGHVALALLWLTRRDSRLRRRIAAAGRAALSNYLGTSIAMTALFYGYGAGLYGRLGRAELLIVVILAWAAMLAWSRPWLDRFAYGPFEWLWRSLARRKIQPFRRANVIARHYQ